MFQFEKSAGINFMHQTYCGEKCIIFQFVLFAVFFINSPIQNSSYFKTEREASLLLLNFINKLLILFLWIIQKFFTKQNRYAT